MARIAIVFGVLLAILGGGLFYLTDFTAYTALIPAYFGIALIVLGAIALNDKLRKHAMHVAAVVALVGFAMPAYRVISALIGGAEFGRALAGQTAMSVLCLVFLGLCVKSFIDARAARKQQEAAPKQ